MRRKNKWGLLIRFDHIFDHTDVETLLQPQQA